MDPEEIREIRKRQRYYKSYLEELTNGRISKKFKLTEIDLIQEFWENKKSVEDFRKDLKGVEEHDADEKNEPFNLDKEREEQLFDNAGNIILPRDRTEVTDRWLESLDDQPIITPKQAPIKEIQIDVPSLKNSLKKLLNPNETVSQAMNRLRGAITVKKNFKKNVRKGEIQEKKKEKKDNENLDQKFKELCNICSDLIAAGCDDLYDWKIQNLCDVKYWKLKGPNGIIGPVDENQIKVWREKGKLKGFSIQLTDKNGETKQGSTWMDFDTFELY
jgi:regulator of replication initiation timing